MFHPGQLKDKIDIVSIFVEANDYSWNIKRSVWARVEPTTKRNIFSEQGFSAKLINILVRKCDVTLHNAIRWNQKHCIITDIIEKDRMYYEISAALIEPVICFAERENEPELDELNRPIYNDAANKISFPAYITEKYVRQTEDVAMSTVESKYVLVSPKEIRLDDGNIVEVDGEPFEILVSHTLSDYKNEYEVRRYKNS